MMNNRAVLQLVILVPLLAAGLAVWLVVKNDAGDSERDSQHQGMRDSTVEMRSLSCSRPDRNPQEPIWQPGQGRDELAVLITAAKAGDRGAAWNLYQAIHFCFGVPDSDRDLRRELNRRARKEQPDTSVAEHEQYIPDKAAEVVQRYEEQLRSMYEKCKDVPRTAGTAYDWLQRAAAGGHADARIEFYQQGLRYAGDSQADRARHVDAAKDFLGQSLAAGDGRALPRLGQILRHEPAISARSMTPDLVEVYALFYAAIFYAGYHDSMNDWRPAWTGFLEDADKILSREQIEQGQRRAMKHLEAVGCEPN